MVKHFKFIVHFFCLVVLPITVFAQTEGGVEEKGMEYLLFEEIPTVSSTGFFATTSLKAPGYTTVIDMDTLQTQPFSDLSYLLNAKVPGVNTTLSANGSLVGVRGIMTESNCKTLFMLDGNNLNFRYGPGYNIGLRLPLWGDIKTMEMVLGPGAIVHGSGAITGFVNLIPRTGANSPGWNTNIGYEIRSGQNVFESGYGKSFGDGRDIYFYAGYTEAEGYTPKATWYKRMPVGTRSVYNMDYFSSDAGAFYSDGQDQNYKVASYINYDDFKLDLMYYSFMPFSQQSRIDTYQAFTIEHVLLAAPQYTYRFNDNNSLEFNFAFDDKDQGQANGSSNWYANEPLHGIWNAVNEVHWEIKPIFRNTSLANNNFAIGFLYGQREFNYGEFDFEGRSRIVPDAVTTIIGSAAGGGWDEWSIFCEDVITMMEKLTLSLGVRYDGLKHNRKITGGLNSWFSYDSNSYAAPDKTMENLSPRIAFAYTIADETVLKGSYQKGFRTPELFYYTSPMMWNRFIASDVPTATYRFPELKPETVESYEVNLHQGLSDLNMGFDLNLFYNTYKNQLSSVNMMNPQSYGMSQADWDAITLASPWWWMNIYGLQCVVNLPGKSRTYGGEFIMDWRPWEKVALHASYGLTAYDNLYVIRYPHQTFKLSMEVKFLNDKMVFYANNVTSSSIRAEKAPTADEYWDSTGISTQFDFSLAYALTQNLTLKVSCINAFKNKAIPVGYEMNTYYASKMSDASLYYLNAYIKF